MSNNQETSFKHIIDINLEQYSEKCFILTGNTIKHKQDIKELGGKWNPSLKAWIFPNMKREVIDKWLETGEKTVEPVRQYFENPVYNPTVNPSVNPVVVNESKTEKSNETKIERRLEILEWKMDRMIDLLLELKIEKTERNSKRNESKVALSEIETKIQPKIETKIQPKVEPKIKQGIEYDDITFLIPEEEEEVNVPRKRLLRR